MERALESGRSDGPCSYHYVCRAFHKCWGPPDTPGRWEGALLWWEEEEWGGEGAGAPVTGEAWWALASLACRSPGLSCYMWIHVWPAWCPLLSGSWGFCYKVPHKTHKTP